MEIKTKRVTINILTASDGMLLTQVGEIQAGSRVFTKQVYLGKADSQENWKEVTEDEAAILEAEDRAAAEAADAVEDPEPEQATQSE